MEANLNSYKENLQDFQAKGAQKISAFDQDLDMKSDSFTLDMEPFSHLTNKDFTLTSRINLQRNLSRKGSQTGAERKTMNSNCAMNDGERDAIPSPKACSMSVTMPEKYILVNQSTDHTTKPQVQLHQIAIMTSGSTTTEPAATPTKISVSVKRSTSFKQSSLFKPRRILIFFATLSSLGTIILICLTLSMAKYNGENNSHANTTQLT